MPKSFASSADMTAKAMTFEMLSEGVYAFTAEGDPNTGVVVGTEGVLVFDSQATPAMAQKVLDALKEVTDLPVSYVVLSHYHAVRTLGASAFSGAKVIASHATSELITERGKQDWESELRRFPRLFENQETITGLTRPDILFDECLTIDLGNLKVEIIHPGPGHTGGDTVLWLPEQRIMFAGDLVESGATPYCGDAYLHCWPQTLGRLLEMEPLQLLPGRGKAMKSQEGSQTAISATSGYVSRLYEYASDAVAQGMKLADTFDYIRMKMDRDYSSWVIYEHCLPFNVSRAFDEASGLTSPSIWTAERDKQVWQALQK